MSVPINPKHRLEALTTERVGTELLVYDERIHKAFCLNAVTAAVLEAADGSRSSAALAEEVTRRLEVPVSVEAVGFALTMLESAGLLAEPLVASSAASTAMADAGRRRLLGGLSLTGAAMMLPAIAAVLAPPAAQAYSGCFNCAMGSGSTDTATIPQQKRQAQQRRRRQAQSGD